MTVGSAVAGACPFCKGMLYVHRSMLFIAADYGTTCVAG